MTWPTEEILDAQFRQATRAVEMHIDKVCIIYSAIYSLKLTYLLENDSPTRMSFLQWYERIKRVQENQKAIAELNKTKRAGGFRTLDDDTVQVVLQEIKPGDKIGW